MKNNVTKKKTTTSTTARMMINNTRTPSTTKTISKLKSNVKSTKKHLLQLIFQLQQHQEQ